MNVSLDGVVVVAPPAGRGAYAPPGLPSTVAVVATELWAVSGVDARTGRQYAALDPAAVRGGRVTLEHDWVPPLDPANPGRDRAMAVLTGDGGAIVLEHGEEACVESDGFAWRRVW